MTFRLACTLQNNRLNLVLAAAFTGSDPRKADTETFEIVEVIWVTKRRSLLYFIKVTL